MGGWASYFGWAQQSTGFLLGMLLAARKKQLVDFLKKYQLRIIIICCISLILAGIIYIQPHDITKITNEQFWVREVIVGAFIIILLILLIHLSFGNKVTYWIGSEMSIYIFSVHGLFINIAEKIINIEKVNLIISFVVVGTIVASGIISIVVYKTKNIIRNLLYTSLGSNAIKDY